MSRRTYLEYQDTQTAIRKPKKTFGDAMEMLKRAIKKRAIQLGHIIVPKPANYWWEYFVPTPCDKGTLMQVGFIKGTTKSEARARLKRELKMKKRLPPGTKLVRSGDADC